MHTIRLRGPWKKALLAGGLVRYFRPFHKPTGLDGGERVWLVIEEPSTAAIELNGQSLGMVGGRFEITASLLAQNLLAVSAAADVATDGLARLEIG